MSATLKIMPLNVGGLATSKKDVQFSPGVAERAQM